MTTLKAPRSGGLDGLLSYYAGLAEDRHRGGRSRGPVDYYLDPDEPPGRWLGQGLTGFGLSGEVTGEELRSVLEGRHPVTGDQLGRAFGDSSARGFDATFSAPKSVSALWALSPDPWVRAEVLAAHDAAVDVAVAWFETHGAVTRRGRDGVLQVDTRGVAVATFRQHTSRTVDPQLHTHALIAAKVQDPTGRWLSLDARFLKYQQRTIGWVYDAALRAELTGRLRVEWETSLYGPVDMVCVPAEVREALSRRSAQVAAKLDDLIRRWSDEHDGAAPVPECCRRHRRHRPSGARGRSGRDRQDHHHRLRRSTPSSAGSSGRRTGTVGQSGRCSTYRGGLSDRHCRRFPDPPPAHVDGVASGNNGDPRRGRNGPHRRPRPPRRPRPTPPVEIRCRRRPRPAPRRRPWRCVRPLVQHGAAPPPRHPTAI
ncbi:MAG: relaxase domain-containing protein [Acidimicrobiia bacterium]|nr:relaxase domain-containing protein [Acidimicrobiia bacterium]